MIKENKIFLGMADGEEVDFELKMSNRHGLIAGATGTGKTVSLKVLAESFSDAGVPVFMADVKGDIAGMCAAGESKDFIKTKVEQYDLMSQGFEFKGYPVNFWDVYGKGGMPLRTTVSEMGPLLMSRILGLTETQEDVLTVVFKIADDNKLLLIDTKDLKAMLAYVEENSAELALDYGNMSKQSLAVIVRSIVALESQGGDQFFGEPALDINDWLKTDLDGKGMIQILDARELVNSPDMYSTFLLWMISELYEALPEVGDLEKPRMVFFFDEAHLLFDTASKSLLEKIEQIVKLIRSKGVGIFFVTQSPRDIPDSVLAQLGNKVQHALHAYTPAEIKAVKQAAESFRANDAFDTYDTLINLGIGEALVSTLEADGVPTVVKRTSILPPQSHHGAIEDSTRKQIIEGSALYKRYNDFFDRDSAYEFLTRKNMEAEAEAERLRAEADKKKQEEIEAKEAEKEAAEKAKQAEKEEAAAAKQAEKEAAAAAKQAEKEAKEAEKAALAAEKAAEKEAAAKKKKVKNVISSTAGSAGSTVGRELGNALGSAVGGKFGKKIGGNVGSTLFRGILKTLFSL
ncbi:MAG: DUF853 domain-containing protein [Lachnospiraceae bacterium]|nr:DUF853 domain-containing protein [Lachnospiraceae bacterium]